MLQRPLRRNSVHRRASMADRPRRAVFLLPCLSALSTAVAQPEPDMDSSGCVDRFAVALFQNQFGRSRPMGGFPGDFDQDGIVTHNDYVFLVGFFGGPACACA